MLAPKTTRTLIRERIEKAEARAKIIEDGKRLFKELHVQPGQAEYCKRPDNRGQIETVRIETRPGVFQELLIDEDEETCRFYAWVLNNFTTLTER